MAPIASAQLFGVVVVIVAACLACGYSRDLNIDVWRNVYAELPGADIAQGAAVSPRSADAAASVLARRACSEFLFRPDLPSATYLVSQIHSMANGNSSRSRMCRHQISTGSVSLRRQVLVLERIMEHDAFDVVMDALMTLINVLGVPGHHAIAIALRKARQASHVWGGHRWVLHYFFILRGLLQRGIAFRPVPPHVRTVLLQQPRFVDEISVSRNFINATDRLLRRHNVSMVNIEVCSIALRNDFPDPHIDADLVRVLVEHGMPLESMVFDAAVGEPLYRIHHAVAYGDARMLNTLLSLGASLTHVSFTTVSFFNQNVNAVEPPTFALDMLLMLVSNASSEQNIKHVLDQFGRTFPNCFIPSNVIRTLVDVIRYQFPKVPARAVVLRSVCRSIATNITDLVIPATFAMPEDDLKVYLSDLVNLLHKDRPTYDDDMLLILSTASPDAVYNGVIKRLPWLLLSNQRFRRFVLDRFKNDPIHRLQFKRLLSRLWPPTSIKAVIATGALANALNAAFIIWKNRKHPMQSGMVDERNRDLVRTSVKVTAALNIAVIGAATGMIIARRTREAFPNASTGTSLPDN
ncbi:Uncharacterized protein PBTT_00997 [Plasmodiophora brassicae]|uniref:Uncharacterized protein n=1 Tax=Plasmodiophora brassicae TaxID=37360 RepID=A0A0G4J0D7_PLABS|nr:hypothetical protein PBRA_001790 [Plasmodiophora brassicae]SPQ93783.1 unnamed protein product [Plasmodiophora brassicae]